MPMATIEDTFTDPFWIPGLIPIIADSREADILVLFNQFFDPSRRSLPHSSLCFLLCSPHVRHDLFLFYIYFLILEGSLAFKFLLCLLGKRRYSSFSAVHLYFDTVHLKFFFGQFLINYKWNVTDNLKKACCHIKKTNNNNNKKQYFSEEASCK